MPEKLEIKKEFELGLHVLTIIPAGITPGFEIDVIQVLAYSKAEALQKSLVLYSTQNKAITATWKGSMFMGEIDEQVERVKPAPQIIYEYEIEPSEEYLNVKEEYLAKLLTEKGWSCVKNKKLKNNNLL